jgi:dipeptidyl aminopeptidase/acylaminoacyl peptidase
LHDEKVRYLPTAVSPDGKLLMGVRSLAALPAGGTESEIWVLALSDDSAKPQPRAFLQSQGDKADPAFSPDGKWVVYTSNENGRNEVYVVPYPGPGGKWQVSNEGGSQPRWAANGRELFYRNGGKLMAVDVESGAGFRPGTPKVLFDKVGMYDVSRDGKRFLMTRPAGSAEKGPPPEIHVVLNWFEELRRRAPMK